MPGIEKQANVKKCQKITRKSKLRFFRGTNKFEYMSLELTVLEPSNKWKFSGL